MLNDLDYIVIGVVLLSGLLALMRGFVREMFSLIAWVGAYFASTKFYAPAIPLAHHYVKNEKAAEWTAMAGVFVVTLIVLIIIGHIVSGFVKGNALTSIDRALGFLYGLTRGALVVALVYLTAVMVFWPDIDAAPEKQAENKDRNPPPELLLKAKTRPLMAKGADLLKIFVPQEMIDKTLKDAEARKAEAEKAAKQKALETLTPTGSAAPGNAPAIDIDKLMNQGSKP